MMYIGWGYIELEEEDAKECLKQISRLDKIFEEKYRGRLNTEFRAYEKCPKCGQHTAETHLVGEEGEHCFERKIKIRDLSSYPYANEMVLLYSLKTESFFIEWLDVFRERVLITSWITKKFFSQSDEETKEFIEGIEEKKTKNHSWLFPSELERRINILEGDKNDRRSTKN